MGKNNPWKIGIGTGSILLGLYMVFSFKENVPSAVFGFIAIAFGIGLIASS